LVFSALRRAPPNGVPSRDLQAVALIERQGEVYDASAVLAQAGLTLLQARLNCLAGDEAGALAMYDRVLRVQVVSSHPRN
jgi:hypothetical protein